PRFSLGPPGPPKSQYRVAPSPPGMAPRIGALHHEGKAGPMSEKLVANAALGIAVSSALLAGMPGCGSSNNTGESTAATSASITDTADPSSLQVTIGVVDPGARGGPPGAGGPIDGLNVNELALFNEGRTLSAEIEGTCNGCQDFPAGVPLPPNAPPGSTNSSG